MVERPARLTALGVTFRRLRLVKAKRLAGYRAVLHLRRVDCYVGVRRVLLLDDWLIVRDLTGEAAAGVTSAMEELTQA